MRCVARRIADGTVLAVIKAWLTAPIIERDKRGMQQSTEARDSNRGTPQGGIITPPTIWQKRHLRTVPAGMGG